MTVDSAVTVDVPSGCGMSVAICDDLLSKHPERKNENRLVITTIE